HPSLGTVLLAELLSEGDASRLERRLVHDDRIAIAQSSYVGLFGDPFDVRDATVLPTQVHPPAGVPARTGGPAPRRPRAPARSCAAGRGWPASSPPGWPGSPPTRCRPPPATSIPT